MKRTPRNKPSQQESEDTVFADTMVDAVAPSVLQENDIFISDSPPKNDAPLDQQPTIGHIGRYALKYRIGEGGLGVVYAAHDGLLGRAIALKTLNFQFAPEHRDSVVDAFLREARAVARLSHPYIVTVHDAGAGEQGFYIAMEHLKGSDLRQLLDGGWQPTPTQAATIIRRVAEALAYAHANGVVHCDIKPSNILMIGRTTPKVLDFGIARVPHATEGAERAALAAGSPYYMAPEQLHRAAVDGRTDVFSLGAVLYELLTGRRPFNGDTLEDVVDAVLNQQPAPPHELDPKIPKTLSMIATLALAKDPAKRFESARQLADALRLALADQSAKEPTQKAQNAPKRQRPRLAIAGVVAGGLLALAAMWSWWQFEGPSGLQGAALAKTTGIGTPGTAASMSGDAASSVTPGRSQEERVSASPSATSTAPAMPAGASAPQPAAATTAAAPRSSSPALATTAQATPATATSSATGATAPTAHPAPAAASALSRNAAKAPSAREAKERRIRETKERETNVAAIPKPAPAAAAPASGQLLIAVSPWGEVEIDGVKAGISPPLSRLMLPEGDHTIVLRNNDNPPFMKTVRITADEPVTLRYRFGS
ncbi:MAG TPA: serine/threonine-protein kinase [Burkholderiaceae bacterium]|nr:serine/threonine-protein kinase [Burkholderiaceae bacterium]